MRLVQFCQTCWACPAQWELLLDDGRYFYARERWDEFTLAPIEHGELGDDVYECDVDGHLSTDAMLDLISQWVDVTYAEELTRDEWQSPLRSST